MVVFSAAAAAERSDSTAAEAVRISLSGPDTLSEKEWLLLADHNPAVWADVLPGLWASHSAQYGQPVHVLRAGSPFWSSRILWNGISLQDPVFGILDLNTIPLLSGHLLVTGSQAGLSRFPADLAVFSRNRVERRAFSRVYYRTGDNGLNHVDVQFERGIGKRSFLRLGTAFFNYGGIFSNSAVHHQSTRLEMRTSVAGKARLTYRLLTSALRNGYPGEVFPNYFVEFFYLRRKAGRQDHLLQVDSLRILGGNLVIQVQLHRLQLRYKDVRARYSSWQRLDWGQFGVGYQKSGPGRAVAVAVRAAPAKVVGPADARASQLPVQFTSQAGLQLPARFSFTFRGRLEMFSPGLLSGGLMIGLRRGQAGGLHWSLSGRYRKQVAPLGYRSGLLPLFENLAWPTGPAEADSLFFVRGAAPKVLQSYGARFRVEWRRTQRFRLAGYLALARYRNLFFAERQDSARANWRVLHSAGVLNALLETAWLPAPGIRFRFQYQFFGGAARLPEWIEIPRHRIGAQMLFQRDFFAHNLHSFLVLNLFYYSGRESYGRDPESGRVLRYTLAPAFVVNVRLLFRIGDARIFLQWQNLTNRSYSLRAFQPVPGWQFHYGVLWNFWN